MRPAVVVHYHEISLKGGNRPLFLRRLGRNIMQATAGCGVRAVRRLPGRLVLDLAPDADLPALRARIGTVFGVANFAPGLALAPDLETVKAAVLELLEGRSFESFRITARRTFKVFPMTSEEVNRELGALVLKHFPTRVNLTQPALTVYVELLPREALVYVDRVPGPGGLPVGVSGRVLSLLSGGIDSPVAARRLQKRGCEVEFVHFHSVPYLADTSQGKARALVGRLVRHQFTARLWLVPFGDIQREVVLAVPPALRVVVYRRLMARIAEALAGRVGALALVTGESLGQVASQTLENIARTTEVVSLPILRPLIGMDKEEIIREAKAIGTYDISIEPDQDCCTLFVPKHPETRTSVASVTRAEARLEVARLVEEGVGKATAETFALSGAALAGADPTPEGS
ncbi:MAG TPA: tRNA uracil 4-sulfurtransferase ThiI [Methylomirabilota bacterium]|jgi:thiamine biosynthesis protein ThiI|nr:tRNA uracil 4-sulfurtransferase ThiI [Methylomirabilota bacterium]